jgi:hypothetical protein
MAAQVIRAMLVVLSCVVAAWDWAGLVLIVLAVT